MADTTRWMHHAAPLSHIQSHARSLAYLGTVDKILTALANEFGTDRKMPSRAFIQSLLDDRNAVGKREYARRA